MNSAERAQLHNWTHQAMSCPGIAILVGDGILNDPRTSECNEQELQEGIIHAWRAVVSGNTADRAIIKGIIHSTGLMQARLQRLRKFPE